MFDTDKGQKTFSQLSKADFADIAYNYACLKVGREITVDEFCEIMLDEKRLITN